MEEGTKNDKGQLDLEKSGLYICIILTILRFIEINAEESSSSIVVIKGGE